MGLIVASTVGLVLWIVLWSIGAKSFDAFMLTVTIVLIAAGVRIGLTYLPDRDAKDL
ncbi:hypothetical protein LRS13_19530 [Svornostia abyssi]|uniref:Uncharacterized protein n=1 Tax=Svornostia abyssi TaxID=2898438 RepID=A0ABY5PE24_9ACTN|nr:hypothetical protein LRS13_19530 [Parviterribacteraceae bacterium J379]